MFFCFLFTNMTENIYNLNQLIICWNNQQLIIAPFGAPAQDAFFLKKSYFVSWNQTFFECIKDHWKIKLFFGFLGFIYFQKSLGLVFLAFLSSLLTLTVFSLVKKTKFTGILFFTSMINMNKDQRLTFLIIWPAFFFFFLILLFRVFNHHTFSFNILQDFALYAIYYTVNIYVVRLIVVGIMHGLEALFFDADMLFWILYPFAFLILFSPEIVSWFDSSNSTVELAMFGTFQNKVASTFESAARKIKVPSGEGKQGTEVVLEASTNTSRVDVTGIAKKAVKTLAGIGAGIVISENVNRESVKSQKTLVREKEEKMAEMKTLIRELKRELKEEGFLKNDPVILSEPINVVELVQKEATDKFQKETMGAAAASQVSSKSDAKTTPSPVREGSLKDAQSAQAPVVPSCVELPTEYQGWSIVGYVMNFFLNS